MPESITNNEIERRWLVAKLPEGYTGQPHRQIEQRYLADPGERTKNKTARLRKVVEIDPNNGEASDPRFDFNQKIKIASEKAKVRLEHENKKIKPGLKRAKQLWDTEFAQKVKLEKTRYDIPLIETSGDALATKKLKAELDIYQGVLQGLKVVEVEFPTLEAAESFSAPDWFGREITKEAAFSNYDLAAKGLPADIE